MSGHNFAPILCKSFINRGLRFVSSKYGAKVIKLFESTKFFGKKNQKITPTFQI